MNVHVISPGVGAVSGVASAVPFALLVGSVFGHDFPAFAAATALACLWSGAVTGGTVGRRAATRPSLLLIAGTAAFAVAVAAPIGTLAYMLSSGRPGDLLLWMIPGLVIYSLPAFLLVALPAVTLGILIAGRLAASSRETETPRNVN